MGKQAKYYDEDPPGFFFLIRRTQSMLIVAIKRLQKKSNNRTYCTTSVRLGLGEKKCHKKDDFKGGQERKSNKTLNKIEIRI
jgi:hypothetical protein